MNDSSLKQIIELLASSAEDIPNDQITSLVVNKVNGFMFEIYDIKKYILEKDHKDKYLNKFKYLLEVIEMYEKLFKQNLDIEKMIKEIRERNTNSDSIGSNSHDSPDTSDTSDLSDSSDEEKFDAIDDDIIDPELYEAFVDNSLAHLRKLPITNNVTIRRK